MTAKYLQTHVSRVMDRVGVNKWSIDKHQLHIFISFNLSN